MIRGEVWLVDFEPSIGGEVQKQRPAVIVSNDSSNRNINRVQVVPITSNVTRIYASEAAITLNGQPRKAMANQITTADKSRLKTRMGVLSEPDMANVDIAIKVQLAL